MQEALALRSERLLSHGFVHGFSTRRGGTSVGAYASLNLGRSVGDTTEHVEVNHTRFATNVGYASDRLFEASQVHGATVLTLRAQDRPGEVRPRSADGLSTAVPGFAVGVRTADCVPVLLADPASGAVAAVHAGWRGVVAHIVREAVGLLRSEGARGDLVAAIGPSIGPCCFEVGDDVAAQLAHAGGDGIVIRRRTQKPHVDLWRAIEHQLKPLGVGAIDTLGVCTVCEGEQFFSYRRDGAASGRMLSVIAARSA